MSNQIITNLRPQVEIDIVRDNNFYFYNRSDNGNLIIHAQRISPDKAAQIIEEFPGHVIHQSGDIRFDEGPHQFSWTAKYWPETEGN